MSPDAGALIYEARRRHAITQQTLARRAGTTQKHVSRIERREISPSIATLARLLAAMGERLQMNAAPGPRDNRSDGELRADYQQLTPSERLAQTAALSRTLTELALRMRLTVVDQPRSRPPVLRAETLLRVLAEHRVDFVITGGFALAAHGVVRGTKDIDVVPDPARANLRRLAHALEAVGAEVMLADGFAPSELSLALDETGLALGGNRVLRTELGRLDVMQDVPGMRGYAALRSASLELEVPGVGPFRFCGLDDLIAMKVATGRPQDELDVTSLQRARRE
jgi:transcriptional regulator with XRE-family HTH domain